MHNHIIIKNMQSKAFLESKILVDVYSDTNQDTHTDKNNEKSQIATRSACSCKQIYIYIYI